ncbi:alpha/beta hydrolase [Kitasatospora sp. NBC_00070]|uniref:alpha/beta hydrolase n=1 Tax=Kitasatospora sp. NBC_00070 TaxID=2975962 RepID=UPI0032434C48
MKIRTVVPALGALAATLLLAGCGSDGSAAAAPSSAPKAADYGCLAQDRADKGSFGLDSVAKRDAYYQDSDAGRAKVAVVFSHENGDTLCDWIPFVEDFTKAGYATLAYTSAGDLPLDIEAAAKYLKAKGVERVVLVGASKGGTGSLAAAAAPGTLPVAAVVTLSAPTYFGSWNGVEAIARIKAPLFVAAQENDQPFAENAAELAKAATAPVKELKIYQGSSHGARLLPQGTAKADLLAFLAKNAPSS